MNVNWNAKMSDFCLKKKKQKKQTNKQTCKKGYQVSKTSEADFEKFMASYTKDKMSQNCPYCGILTDKLPHTW